MCGVAALQPIGECDVARVAIVAMRSNREERARRFCACRLLISRCQRWRADSALTPGERALVDAPSLSPVVIKELPALHALDWSCVSGKNG